MNGSASRFSFMEEDLKRLSARMPGSPATAVLLCRLLMHVSRDVTSMLELQFKPQGLTEAEFRVLTTLFSHPTRDAFPSDLCTLATLTPPNISRIGDALVARGLITRIASNEDRRRMVLRITEAGDELVRVLLPKLTARLREMLIGFSEAEQSETIAMLRHVGCLLEKVMHNL
jgi:MarR family transcriptional regulator, negative regulator of the multidrug operon emrRAB